ncbi:MAG: ABC transporter ATP-binding protein [Acidobacteria bacterium]|nr:ABC transporter ATP-binding protein [Acidobacteriota bacterium]
MFLDGITKSFGSHCANRNVTIRVQKGTVHAILGENGAGKTTLMNILCGLYRPDRGRILIDGAEAQIENPRKAQRLGIGMVHQHFMLVRDLTVVENVLMGHTRGMWTLRIREQERRLEELSRKYGLEIDAEKQIWRLPIGMQQRVEILRLLDREASLMIFDEPTSVLTPREVGGFFEILRRLRNAGKTILFITHKLAEVMAIADRVTVMREGSVVHEAAARGISLQEMGRLMIGRDLAPQLTRASGVAGPVVLEVKDLRVRNDRGLPALDSVTFSVRESEILGIAGVDGNGQSELCDVLAGLRRPESGLIRVGGQDITAATVAERRHTWRIGFIPEDRHRYGLVLDDNIFNNLVLRNYAKRPFSHYGLLHLDAILSHARRLVERFNIKIQDLNQKVRFLSGGNQQKVVLARELSGEPRVLIATQPCKGLDVGAIEAVQRELLEQRRLGVAVVYVSTELDHILEIADRIAVMFRGKIMGVFTREEVTLEQIGLLMMGLKGEGA